MKIYKTQKKIKKDIKNGALVIKGDVKFECSFSIEASINVAGDINARDINAWDIDAGDINAGDINAGNIDAWNILYYAFCCVYKSIKCFSIKAKGEKHQEPICLDGELEYKEKEVDGNDELDIDGKKYSKQTIKRALKEYIK